MPVSGRKNLLLCLDAFDTLFTPSTPIPTAYAQIASRHGIQVPSIPSLASSFKSSFKQTSQKYPNYGKHTSGLTPETWWEIIITSTFSPFLQQGQKIPPSLVKELHEHYSSNKGYKLFDDVRPFFNMLRDAKQQKQQQQHSASTTWPWDTTVVGIITNSDDRIASILSSFNLEIASRRYNTTTITSTSSDNTNTPNKEDINFVLLSYDTSVEKPNPLIFSYAEQMLSSFLSSSTANQQGKQLQASDFEKLHVGDDLEKDYLGAREAGWGALLLLRRDQSTGQGIQHVELTGEDGQKKSVDAVGSLLDVAGWRPT
jgi:FMN phosphatase YigB (HAD superfamily)